VGKSERWKRRELEGSSTATVAQSRGTALSEERGFLPAVTDIRLRPETETRAARHKHLGFATKL